MILSKPNDSLVNYYVLFLGTYGLQTKKIDNAQFDVTFNIEQIKETDFIGYSQSRYETLKEFLYFLGNEANGSWYISVTY